jgi:transposase
LTIFCGVDWAEQHHDVAVVNDSGQVLARRRISDDVAGLTQLSSLLAEHTGTQALTPVDIAIETDRGLLVAALRAAGHRVYAVNPKAVDRYRDRHAVSGAKSDPGDALVLAHLLRTDRAAHRPLPDDSHLAQAIKVLARAHQDMIWARQQDANRLRSLLRQFYPAALAAFPSLHGATALVVLAAAPTPTAAARLSPVDLDRLLHQAGRGHRPAEITRLVGIFAAPQLRQPPVVEQAMGAAAAAIVATLMATNTAVTDLQAALTKAFEQHPDAETYRSLAGLGIILAARVLGELGDDPARFPTPASLRGYGGTAPITRASGKRRLVLARHVRNRRLADACYLWAFAALTKSPGARARYDRRRAAGDGHNAALRNLASKLLGQLHHCLANDLRYDEASAWPQPNQPEPAAA